MKRVIKDEVDYKLFGVALENYLSLCKKENTEIKYYKNWSTFVNQYEDYLEVELDDTIKPTTKSDRITEQNRALWKQVEEEEANEK